jgi:ribosomal-protein-alanine N-acetyltransferase
MLQTRLTTRPATIQDYQKLANLVHFESFVHRHLDYRPPLDWVGSNPFLIIEKKQSIEAALACPPDPANISWLRLFAASPRLPIDDAWDALWLDAREQLLGLAEVTQVAAIATLEKMEILLARSRFDLVQKIVMLTWDSSRGKPHLPTAPAPIRPMNYYDLDAVAVLDRLAFQPIWQNSRDYLELAFRQAAIATVAEEDGILLGYQISTASPLGGHLARLAVHPQHQGRGIGSALVNDLLNQFERRGAKVLTVNTQHDNPASLALYLKAGFRLTGEEYPIYRHTVQRNNRAYYPHY